MDSTGDAPDPEDHPARPGGHAENQPGEHPETRPGGHADAPSDEYPGGEAAHGRTDSGPGRLEQVLHAARAHVLADLAAGDVADADVVSMVEKSVSERRWWVEQWPAGAEFVTGLVAQDVQDALLERHGRWPLCPVCSTGDPHALEVDPELGADPHWVCSVSAVRVAAVGNLATAPGFGPRG